MSICKADNDARNGFFGTAAAQRANCPDEYKPRASSVTEVRIDGASGIVTFDYAFNGQSQTIENQLWILEAGTWHFDDW